MNGLKKYERGKGKQGEKEGEKGHEYICLVLTPS